MTEENNIGQLLVDIHRYLLRRPMIEVRRIVERIEAVMDPKKEPNGPDAKTPEPE